MKHSIAAAIALILSAACLTGCGMNGAKPAQTDPTAVTETAPKVTVSGTGTTSDPWQVGEQDPGAVLVSTYDSFLIVSGSGPMLDFPDMFSTPWASIIGDVTYISFDDGITHLGAHAFGFAGGNAEGCGVRLPADLVSIGSGAFEGAALTEALSIPAGVKSIGSRAFADSTVPMLDMQSSPTVGEDAFRNVTADLYVRSDWEKAARESYGGDLSYHSVFSFNFDVDYGDPELNTSGVWYALEEQEFELDAEAMSGREGYHFSRYEVVGGSLSIPDPTNPVLNANLHEDVQVRICFEQD